MRTISRITELRAALKAERDATKTIAFVPTMGALHEGHLSLIRRAAENDVVVASIFVNPLQFGPREDLASYPRDPEGDAAKAEAAGVDFLFIPGGEEIYPRGEIATKVNVGPIGEVWEGEFRPGHFDGVATVCVKLFNIVQPTRAYFGEKDAQQLTVIRQVVRDLDLPVEVVSCPTVREPDGLALSSRNAYLDADSRKAASVLSRSLFEAEAWAKEGERSAEKLERRVAEIVGSESEVELQYVAVVDPGTFERMEEIEDEAVLALAAICGATRLIDNVRIKLGGSR